jgi:hypothetical protein
MSRAVKLLNTIFNRLKLEKHPDRTAVLGDYVTRWWRWLQAGISDVEGTLWKPLLTHTVNPNYLA